MSYWSVSTLTCLLKLVLLSLSLLTHTVQIVWLLKPESHYRRYFPRLEILLGSRTTSKENSFLPRFSVSITLQAVYFRIIGIGWNTPVPQLPSEVCMQPSDIVAKRPFTPTGLMLLYYSERRPSHNLTYTFDYTFKYHSMKFICECSDSSAQAHVNAVRGVKILNIWKLP